jgi:uncharacterized membrane protein
VPVIDDFNIARVVHVVAAVAWIGGVTFVTTVVLPWVRRAHAPEQRLAAFRAIEGGFATQARVWVALVGLSGLWMTWRADLWSRFAEFRFWWMHAMVCLWLVFAVLLYIVEPLALHRHMQRSLSPARDFARLCGAHVALIAAALVTAIGAVGGSHGLF